MNKEITSRIDINIGTKCNAKCKFCYYLDSLHEPFKDFDFLINQLHIYRKIGIKKLHITGGEPSIYKKLFELVSVSKKMGFLHIGIITNGIMLKNKKYVESCKNAGIDSFIISLHGHNAQMHDELTQTKGSFDAVLKGIENLKIFNIPFQINYVINIFNYKYLVEFSELMAAIKPPEEVTFLYFNPMNESYTSMNYLSVKFSHTFTYLKDALDLLNQHKISVCFKFIPICVLQNINGHFPINFPQAIYEDWEWNYDKRFMLSLGKRKYYYMLLKHFHLFEKEQINTLPFGVLKYLCSLYVSHTFFYTKLPECKMCQYEYVCLGVDKYYLDMYGVAEFKPVEGKKIIHPDFNINTPRQRRLSKSHRIVNNLFYYLSTFYNKLY